MLDTATKKRIDDCRDILVGKLPDPKAQIEQITIALIYKFMDDMDKEAVELGGKAKFFSNYILPDPKNPGKEIMVDFGKYSWDNLFDTKVTASEMLTLYSEAIAGMDKNPNIPQLFRDIFKNAFLPYRDPETLKLFLKTIGDFEYTHSEKLGDAFEYLLSVMGSQGDAGQFRTPRHIIDFLVKVVNPQKTDTILDPACGTAGFLISAFKHIIHESGTLTPDDRRRMINNFRGYDISPDMVRLSLVNLYLHGFSDPHIYEYDTLTSEDRWNETFDVILANPPFMSPKGGIRPHKKFSVTSNRSEVLFVDYIAEHLNPKGRAGIIVPEGVIFQSGTAYKELRKMLVENYLYAVVSLPAGVFNPYSGVKTSILLMDKTLAKASDKILFVKIDNDGYGLGAQRNPVKGGQLEEAVEIIRSFANGGNIDVVNPTGVPVETRLIASLQAHAVPKTEIAKNGDYNLSGERYKTVNFPLIANCEFVPLSEICEIQRGGSPRPIEDYITENTNGINWIKIGDVGENDKFIIKTREKIRKEGLNKTRLVHEGDFILSNSMSFGRPYIVKISGAIHDGWLLLRMKDNQKINQDYLYEILRSDLIKKQYEKLATGGVVKNLNSHLVSGVQIPLPPLSVQEEIVAEIEGYQKIIDGAKMVVENYKPKIDIDPDWDMVKLGEVCEIKAGGTPSRTNPEFWNGNIPWFSSGELNDTYTLAPDETISEAGLNNSNATIFPKGSLLVGMYDTAAFKMSILDRDAAFNQAVCGIKPNKNIDLYFLMLFFTMNKEYYLKHRIGVRQRNLNKGFISEIQIPKISLKTQHQIVSQIEKEQALVNANKQLIALFGQKIKDRIARVWGISGSETTEAYATQDISLGLAAEGEEGYGG